jgi:hypothetical protein
VTAEHIRELTEREKEEAKKKLEKIKSCKKKEGAEEETSQQTAARRGKGHERAGTIQVHDRRAFQRRVEKVQGPAGEPGHR